MEFTIEGTAVTIERDRVRGNVEQELEQYLDGEPVTFDVDIDLADRSPFQRQVLQALRDIPYGETRTYKEIAEAIGNPGATQAVAQACKMNPAPVIIPCHRVVAEDGLGGYAYGEDVKQALLELEGAL
ncbi:MAG: methylated-DNA--[protein]-cysteine S-methyltransferase [Candidatus Nanohaloarchaea archaeon]|nr:methylated-DNA--[protein]-cysteine S-methyltransferase [Candidatus Nanohaloarchaea archaeon]